MVTRAVKVTAAGASQVEQTKAAYVSDAGQPGERWYDEADAKQQVLARLPVSLGEGEDLDGLVGFEVAP